MMMTLGNTCTYINELTHNNNSDDSISSSGFLNVSIYTLHWK